MGGGEDVSNDDETKLLSFSLLSVLSDSIQVPTYRLCRLLGESSGLPVSWRCAKNVGSALSVLKAADISAWLCML